MNILKNRTVLGLICIVLSLIICFGLTPMWGGAVKAQTAIVRMTKNVSQGDIITADMVTLVKVGGHNLPDNVMKEQENVIGKYAKFDMLSGDYILSGKLSDTPLTEFAYLHELDGNHQAISITIKSFAAGLSGKLAAGDIVSLIASDVGDFRETIAPPELQYVKVIAVTDAKGYDKSYAENEDEEKELPSSVTLLVLPVQARLLAELEATGRIHCTLVYRGTEKDGEAFIKIQEDYLNPPEPETEETEAAEETGEPKEDEESNKTEKPSQTEVPNTTEAQTAPSETTEPTANNDNEPAFELPTLPNLLPPDNTEVTTYE